MDIGNDIFKQLPILTKENLFQIIIVTLHHTQNL